LSVDWRCFVLAQSLVSPSLTLLCRPSLFTSRCHAPLGREWLDRMWDCSCAESVWIGYCSITASMAISGHWIKHDMPGLRSSFLVFGRWYYYKRSESSSELMDGLL
jgi:hypothetical protein